MGGRLLLPSSPAPLTAEQQAPHSLDKPSLPSSYSRYQSCPRIQSFTVFLWFFHWLCNYLGWVGGGWGGVGWEGQGGSGGGGGGGGGIFSVKS